MYARLAALALLLAACVRNPATGKLELDLLPESQEISMGQDAKKQTEQSVGLYKDDKLQSYVSELGMKCAATSSRKNLPWSYEIVDDSSVNAFALPGGPVFVTRGLLGTVSSEAELVAVLGHETGHVSARHSANQLSKQTVAQVGLGVGSVLSPTLGSLAQAASAGLQVLFLKYSRDDETQADELGFRSMTQVGYDPRQMLNLFATLKQVTDLAGGGKLPEWEQTHPIPENRYSTTQQRLKTELKDVDPATLKVERDSYLPRIEGIVYGDDPRQGYFTGDRFVQPSLHFSVDFPHGWQHQNTPQAVAAGSPQQDAVLQLAPAGKMSPDEARQKFFQQQGIQQGPNGTFAAQTQQGTIEGMVAFPSLNGDAYLFLGYTAQGKLQQYGDTFSKALGSFRQTNEGGDVQPARIHLVRLSQPMSVAEFNRQHPSSIKVEEVALINGVEANGTIPAGLAKQVTGGAPK